MGGGELEFLSPDGGGEFLVQGLVTDPTPPLGETLQGSGRTVLPALVQTPVGLDAVGRKSSHQQSMTQGDKLA